MRSAGARPDPSLATRRVTRLVTGLDVVFILSAATSIVMALGARARFSPGPLLITLHDPVRPLALAVMVLALRWLVGRGQPILPSLKLPGIVPQLEAERARLARPAPATPEVKYYALAAALGSLIWLTPHLANFRHVPDAGDPIFSAWRLARFGHQLMNAPTQLFDGNILHPHRYTLTYSDPMFLEGFAALPFIAAGADPIIVSNALLLASFPLCALAFFYAAWRLTSEPQAACVAGILGGLCAFKLEHYSHLELQFLCFAPLALLALLRMMAAPSWRTGAWFGAMVTSQWLACMYLGVMLFVFLAPVGLLAAAAWQRRPSRALVAALATSVAVILAVGSLTAIPFLRSQADRGERSFGSVRHYSATPISYLDPHPRLATYRDIGSSANVAERELFPGALPFALGAIGLLPPVSVGTIALMAGTATAFEGSLGANGLIYDELYKYLIPFRGMRVPARFGALVHTGLILLAAYGARRVLRLGRTRASRGVIFGVLAAGALIDMRPDIALEPYHPSVPPIYSSVNPDMVLAELPMELKANFSYMYFSTFHWARLINGETGYVPASHSRLAEEMALFPAGDLLPRLRERGATHVTVNCKLFPDPSGCPSLLETMDGMKELQLISSGRWQGAHVRLYQIR